MIVSMGLFSITQSNYNFFIQGVITKLPFQRLIHLIRLSRGLSVMLIKYCVFTSLLVWFDGVAGGCLELVLDGPVDPLR